MYFMCTYIHYASHYVSSSLIFLSVFRLQFYIFWLPFSGHQHWWACKCAKLLNNHVMCVCLWMGWFTHAIWIPYERLIPKKLPEWPFLMFTQQNKKKENSKVRTLYGKISHEKPIWFSETRCSNFFSTSHPTHFPVHPHNTRCRWCTCG